LKEIERIIKDILDEEIPDYVQKEIASAIEQYVIKARIEELENLRDNTSETGMFIKWQILDDRIAELKKGLSERD